MRVALGNAWAWYSNRLKVAPLTTNIVSSVMLVSVGDVTAQSFERTRMRQQRLRKEEGENVVLESDGAMVPAAASPASSGNTTAIQSYRSEQYEWRRTLVFGSFTVLTMPLWLGIYRVGDRLFQHQKPTLGRAVRQGVFTWLNAMAFNPVFVTYITAMSAIVIHGVRTPAEVYACVEERFKKNFFTHAAVSLAFWSPQWPILFLYLPPHLRVFYASCMQIAWNSVVSYIQHRD